jgi:TorA maturation chaperone TorD
MSTMITDASNAVSLLSIMYLCKPSKEVLENWKILLAENTSPLLHDLTNAINKIDTNSDRELEDLLWEYTRLFIGPYRLPCPPWESVYTSPKRLMMQEVASEVQNIYRATGLTINSTDIMPDHIGAELNFLSILFQRINTEGGGTNDYIKISEKFLNEHVIKWVPRFTRDMEEAADVLFYKALAQVTRNVLVSINETSHYGRSEQSDADIGF